MLKNSIRVENCVHNAFEKFKKDKKRYTDYYCTAYILIDDFAVLAIIKNSNNSIMYGNISIKGAKRYKDVYDAALNYFNKQL